MLRGTLVLFAGMFTITILRRQLYIHNWLGMVLITAGAALVGASSVLYQSPNGPSDANMMAAAGLGVNSYTATAALGSHLHYTASYSRVASRGMLDIQDLTSPTATAARPAASSGAGLLSWLLGGSSSGMLGAGSAEVAAAPLFGDVLVVVAQMFTALQFIMEEKYLVQFKVPALLAVGLEGCWGLLLCAIALPLTSVIIGRDGLPIDDALAAFRAIFTNPQLGLAVYSSILSIAFFNFFGVSVTKSLSGAARATIDACRTLFIWLYALHAGWERFHMLEVVGFLVLISGTSLYNEILKSCLPGFTPVTEHQPPQQPRRRHRTTPPSVATASRTDAATPDELVIPLLADSAAESTGIPTAVGSRAPPVPLRRPAPAHTQAFDAAQSSGTSGSWVYTMARSMRMGIHTLSPQSLGISGGLAPEEGSQSDYSGSESGSYMSSTPGGLLASSLRQDGGVSGTSLSPTRGLGPDDFIGFAPPQWQGSGSGSGRARVSFGETVVGGQGSAAGGGGAGPAAGPSPTLRGPPGGAGASSGRELRPAIRRGGASLVMQRSASLGNLPVRQDSMGTNQPRSSGRPPRGSQQ
eukprot:GHUV01016759.1.p1 GENE.GHUV01016759.1~~GHUV01016759.1.p1  ORF type:complete len:582 (+),score=158.63 GHUV01016759.1:1207-2952(+)